eukprot:TRINITY_DN12818_c0_g1_i1.p1 TRINITY_DN12818_c0_g1~~TRINITY_DN12818_c0_g1_i1.p1  ORF type:complete len:195 (-),score=41.19 TRINITY_DN12818_c0_g1_i1:46-630(-)
MKHNQMEHDVTEKLDEFVKHGAALDEALHLFDSLPPISTSEMLGSWIGSEIQTGCLVDGLLVLFNWHGKVFESTEVVHPLVFKLHKNSSKLVYLNPIIISLQWIVVWFKRLFETSEVLRTVFSALLLLFVTTKPAARLRIVQYRGVTSAGMVYDTQPIIDSFRKVDENTVMGVMDSRALSAPYVFVLRRQANLS